MKIIVWLAFIFGCFLPASALTPSAPENRVWEIFSTVYDAPVVEAITGYDSLLRSTTAYDNAQNHRYGGERRSALGTCALSGTNAEFKAAEGAADVLRANRIAGRAAEAQAAIDLQAQGYTIIGSQVTARTAAGVRYIDHLVQSPAGDIFAVEVKAGNAVRSSSQLIKDDLMFNQGATLGRNAGVLQGQTLMLDTVELHY